MNNSVLSTIMRNFTMLRWLIFLSTVSIIASFGDANCAQNNCEVCIDAVGRKEIRELTQRERSLVASAFRKEKRLSNFKEWEHMITTKGACKLARKMDISLSKFNLKTPYWNMKLDNDLENDRFSTIFTRNFFPLAKRLKKRSHRSLPKDSNILMAIRNSGHGQIFKFLNSIALILGNQVTENCTKSCLDSPYLYCTLEKRCSSKLLSGASCEVSSKNPKNSQSPCYESSCQDKICVASQFRDRDLSSSTIPSQSLSSEDIVFSLLNDTLAFEVEGNSTVLKGNSDFGEDSNSTETTVLLKHTVLMPTHQTTSPPTTTIMSSTISTLRSSKLPSKATLKLVKSSSARQQIMRNWNRSINFPKYRFNDSLPFPTVYFPATVIEGEFQRKKRMQRRAVGTEAHSVGSNLPIGYNYDIEALSHASSTIVFRVLDPASAFAVEFYPFVSQRGTHCKQFCLENKQYVPCGNTPIRLSRFAKISTPIIWSQTPEKAVESQFSGKGYYRKRKKNYLLFSC